MGYFDYPEDSQETGADQVTVLEGLSDEEWSAVMKHAEHRLFTAGEVLIRPGERDDSVYLLVEGSVELVVPSRLRSEKTIAVINAGSAFGEIGFFDRKPRIVTVRAHADGSILRITRGSFEELAAWQPALARRLLFDLGMTLAVRLRQTAGILSG